MSVPLGNDERDELLAVSTEDGRVVFYSTKTFQEAGEDDESQIPYVTAVAQIGGRQAGFPGRIKDFEILNLEGQPKEFQNKLLLVTGNSEGAVRIWTVDRKDLALPEKSTSEKKDSTRQTGKLLTTYETGHRVTCLASFIMLPAEDPATLLDSDEEEEEELDDDDNSSSEESEDEE